MQLMPRAIEITRYEIKREGCRRFSSSSFKMLFLVKGNFTWSDVGSWEEVYQLSEKDDDGNVKLGNVYTDLAMDSYIYSPDRITALIGIDNLIVINHEDTLLICKRDKSQDVKKIIDFLKFNKMDEYR